MQINPDAEVAIITAAAQRWPEAKTPKAVLHMVGEVWAVQLHDAGDGHEAVSMFATVVQGVRYMMGYSAQSNILLVVHP